MYDIVKLRDSEFPISANYIYFNHAGISPLPVRSRDAVRRVTDELTSQPTNCWLNEGVAMSATFRQQLAAYINAESDQEIVPTTSTANGINSVAQAIAWRPGDNVLVCDVEFPSNVYPWLSLQRDGVTVRLVPAQNGGLTLEGMAPFVDSRTRLVAVSAVQFFTGHRTDLAALGAFCRERGILFAVDAIQAIGHMPFDVQAMSIDLLISGGQKSIMALPGSGFIYARSEVAEQLQPRAIAGNSTINYLHWLDYDLTMAPGAQRFLSGTYNLPGMFSVVESLGLIKELGVSHIAAHTCYLADLAINRLCECGYEVITPRDAHGPIVTFRAPGTPEAVDALVGRLAERHITVVKHLDAQGRPHVRASFHCYNTPGEIEEFLAVLQEEDV